MSLIPPGAYAISEFARQSNGTYLHATCVETSALMLAIAQDPHRPEFAALWMHRDTIGDYLEGMVKVWRTYGTGVGPQGTSYWGDAATWLTSKGFSVDANIMSPTWYADMVAGFAAGDLFLVGVRAGGHLPGDESGVGGHGLAAFGVRPDGTILCGDPDNALAQVNMPGDPIGKFVAYSQIDFADADISSLTRVHPLKKVSMPIDLTDAPVAHYFKAQPDGSWLCYPPDAGPSQGKVIAGALLYAYQNWPAAGELAGLTALGLPLSDALPDAKFPHVFRQLFTHAVLTYDPQRQAGYPSGSPPSANACYVDELDTFVVTSPAIRSLLTTIATAANAGLAKLG